MKLFEMMALGAENQAFSISAEASNVKVRQSPESSFLTRIGFQEIYSSEMWKAAVTELVATATFVFSLATTIIACLESHSNNDPKFVIPIVVFLITFFWFLTTAPLSSGFFSPTFAFMAALTGLITFVRALFYSIAHMCGAVLGYALLKVVMDPNFVHKYMLGGCMVNGNGEGVNAGTALLVEFLCTFIVLFLAMTVLLDKQKCQEIGLTMLCVIISGAYAITVFLSTTVTGRVGYGGVGLNPARCLAPALLMGGSLWNGHWVFWIGPLCSCFVYYCYSLTLPKKGFVRLEKEEDVLQLIRASCLESNSLDCLEGKVLRKISR